MTSVAVLGCGPAGLLAAHAAFTMGVDHVVIYSMPMKSPIMGAQYCHREIPYLTGDPDGVLKYHYVGTKQGYATKVYGSPEADCSWGKFPIQTQFWKMQEVYDNLWEKYSELIVEKVVTSDFCYSLERGGWDLVVSSVPKRVLCDDPTAYQWHEERVVIQHGGLAANNEIVYNGLPDDDWYRTSNIGGYEFTEYPGNKDFEGKGFAVVKPLATDCDVWPHWLMVGRYGKWDKEELAHQAYFDTVDRLNKLGMGDAL